MFLDVIKKNARKEWLAYTKHRFGKLIATGKLTQKAFNEYIRQDIVFLHHYAQCWDKLALLAPSNEQMQYAKSQVSAIVEEEMAFRQQMHITSLNEIKLLKGTSAYVDYMNQVADQNDYNALFFVLLACFVGYAHLGKYILTFNINSRYREWIKLYISPEFFQASDEIMAIAFKQWTSFKAAKQSECLRIFKKTLVLEKDFFDQVL